jgi:putative transposase
MLLVERHYTKGNPQIVELCKTSKELYNKCNYYMRHRWFKNLQENNWDVQLPDLNQLVQLVHEEVSFKNLHNTKTAKQTVRKVISDWWNFKKALKAYKQNPSAFEKKPRPPYYKKLLAQVIFYNETIKKKPLKQGIITPTNGCFEIKSIRKFKQVVITPKTSGFVIEVQYEELLKKGKSKGKGVCCIDVGLNTLCAITSDQHAPVLVNGRIIKSINQWFNKHPSKRNGRKRYWRLENYFHHVSKMIITNCLQFGIGKIIIGKNDGWKQEINIGHKNNQHFQYVPYCGLFEKIKYKATMEGIEVIFTEEAHTSKASFLDHDPLPKYGETVPQFSGKRIGRGLYRSGSTTWNADVNGSLNIGRKVIGEALYGIVNRSVAATPVAINPLKLTA